LAKPRKNPIGEPTRLARVGEYRFKIGAYSPTKIPMQRLAEYMNQIALILGEPNQVHFGSLAPGSTVIVAKIEREAVPKVHERVTQVKKGGGPTEARRAYTAANRMLREDNTNGSLKGDAVILPFPGRDETQEQFAVVRQQGFVEGKITGVTGRDKTVHITLTVEDEPISGLWTTRAIAKQLAGRYDEPVRLHGRGRWQRDAEGAWSLIDFKIESFEPLDDVPLSTALERLRAIPTEWDDNAYAELDVLRHGPGGRMNGGD
jgi:hypothetical protein